MLEQKLRELEQSDVYPFHMPGHKRTWLPFANPYAIDITEIEGFDNLHHATGILREAQQKAAELYDTKKAYYLVNGSTCGLLAAISAAVTRGGKILVARNCHKAVYHAMYLWQLVPVYLYPKDTPYGIQGQVTPQMVQKQLEQTPDVQAVVITSPTYDGVVSDIQKIADIVHRYQIPLIVDEAHGAHFGFSLEFPENATRLGADAVIMSVHKTLPAFTQTALLHLCSERIAENKIEQFLGIYETSSPSYILMAGIEKSLQMIEKEGKDLFVAYSRRLAGFREKTKDLKTLRVLGPADFSKKDAFSFDPGKLLLLTGNSMSGQKLQEILLQEYGLQMEMASGNYVTAMTSIMDTDEGFTRLSDALECIDGTVHKKEETSEISPREIYREQKTVMTIDQALDAEQKTVRLEEAAGAVSGDYVYLYPPGIPILVPGEAIDVQTAETIRHCIRLGLEVEGLPDLTCINVVK